jgi:hypothetical protein
MSATAVEAEVREAVAQMLDAMNEGDPDRLRSVLSASPDAVHIGTDPDEWWSSEQVVAALGGGGPSGIRVLVDDVTVHQAGAGVVWIVGHGRFVADGGKDQPVRMSGVAVREGDSWVFVHSHASIAVSNEQIFS